MSHLPEPNLLPFKEAIYAQNIIRRSKGILNFSNKLVLASLVPLVCGALFINSGTPLLIDGGVESLINSMLICGGGGVCLGGLISSLSLFAIRSGQLSLTLHHSAKRTVRQRNKMNKILHLAREQQIQAWKNCFRSLCAAEQKNGKTLMLQCMPEELPKAKTKELIGDLALMSYHVPYVPVRDVNLITKVAPHILFQCHN